MIQTKQQFNMLGIWKLATCMGLVPNRDIKEASTRHGRNIIWKRRARRSSVMILGTNDT
jgi:hypothetical protein